MLDAQLRHSIYQQRFATQVVRDIIIVLNNADRGLVNLLRVRLAEVANSGGMLQERLTELLAEVKRINAQAYSALAKQLAVKLKDFAIYEAAFQHRLISSFLPDGVPLALPPAALVTAAVESEPLQGRLLAEWMAALSDSKYARIRDTIRTGIVEGRTTDQMVRDIVGTAALNYQDGVIEVDRRGAQAVVRTATNAVANEARDAVFEENKDIIDRVRFVATLDDRTCEECAPLDGEEYALGEGPRPPLHINCRCTTIPVMAGKYDILPLSDMTRAAKGDETGQVAATMTYQDWLGRQSAAFQDETLGPSRGALFRRGDIELSQFVNRNGEQLTLDQLRAKEPDAFTKANVT